MQLPEILLYAYFPRKLQFDFESEAYQEPVLFLLADGQFSYRFSLQEAYTCIRAGEMIFCPAGYTFFRRVDAPVSLHMLKFGSASFLPAQPLQGPMTERMLQDLPHMAPYGFCRGEQIDARLRHYGQDLLLELDKTEAVHTQAHDIALQTATDYMRRHMQEKITNDTLCRLLCCSEVSLIRRFVSGTKQTPQQYLTQMRLAHGRRLLSESDLPIREVAANCGFDDPLYFSRRFTQHYGMAPRAFRQQFRL